MSDLKPMVFRGPGWGMTLPLDDGREALVQVWAPQFDSDASGIRSPRSYWMASYQVYREGGDEVEVWGASGVLKGVTLDAVLLLFNDLPDGGMVKQSMRHAASRDGLRDRRGSLGRER